MSKRIISIICAVVVFVSSFSYFNSKGVSTVNAAGTCVVNISKEQYEKILSDRDELCKPRLGRVREEYNSYKIPTNELYKYLDISDVNLIDEAYLSKYAEDSSEDTSTLFEIMITFQTGVSYTSYKLNGNDVEAGIWYHIDNWPENGYSLWMCTYEAGGQIEIWVDKSNSGSSSSSTSGSGYSSEWINGKWYNADGSQTYDATLQWKSDGSGWWVEDSKGWYPHDQWLKIDRKWYYFTSNGYMDYGEYRNGCWLNSDGTMADGYTNGTWHSDSTGWWFEDGGWYPTNQYLWIDGVKYHFNEKGYID